LYFFCVFPIFVFLFFVTPPPNFHPGPSWE
jgi:hypothetical protein